MRFASFFSFCARTVVLAGLAVISSSACAQPGTTVRISQLGTVQGSSPSQKPAISLDGNWVAFESAAANLVSGDTNVAYDIYVWSRSTGQILRASISTSGQQANQGCWEPSISADGRYIAYHSYASTLVPGDTNNYEDVFVFDRVSAVTTRVSVGSSGEQTPGGGESPAICPSGSFVVFVSIANSLVPGDTNGQRDVFVKDLSSGALQRVSVGAAGTQSNAESADPCPDQHASVVAFQSSATNLVPNDTNGQPDVFVRDRVAGVTTRVSVSSAGVQANGTSDHVAISADGRYVAFRSNASNLVAGDTNGAYDVFLHDRATGTTSRVSVSTSGVQGTSGSERPSISSDGRYVAFVSYAPNLVAGDTNSSGDVFVHDTHTGVTSLESRATTGVSGNRSSTWPSIDGSGAFLSFDSNASNLTLDDTNNFIDVFGRQLREPATTVTGSIEHMGYAADPSALESVVALYTLNGVFVERRTLFTDSTGRYSFTTTRAGATLLYFGCGGFLTRRVQANLSGTSTIDVVLAGGDVDRDDRVDLTDFLILAAHYEESPLTDPRADLNGDGACDLQDFLILASSYESVGDTP